MSKRTYDLNGWLEVKDNPISKVGVFDYLGVEIGASEPDRIYRVYRPEEELNNEETINSFRLMPFIDDHEMLGIDATPAEKKGIQGVIGENVWFDYPYLRGNIKVLSSSAIGSIAKGKIDLSPGYRARYEFTPGSFNGDRYEVIQRRIRANHLALVDEGRTGPDISVQDHVITIDTKELLKMNEEENKNKTTTDEAGFTPEQLEAIKQIVMVAIAEARGTTDADPDAEEGPVDTGAAKEGADAAEEGAEAAVEAAEAAAEAAETGEPTAVENAEVAIEQAEEAITEAKEHLDQATTDSLSRRIKRLRRSIGTMDTIAALNRKVNKLQKSTNTMDTGALMKQIGARDALARKLTPFIGVFDHSVMTAQQVAEYGVGKLNIQCGKGHESIALDAWMQGRVPDSQKTSITMDKAISNQSILDKWGK